MRWNVQAALLLVPVGLFAFGRLAGVAQGAPTPAPLDPNTIYVDSYCRIRAAGLGANTPATRAFTDSGICSVGWEKYSEKWETTIVAGKRKSKVVLVGEHTFMLHNPTSRPMSFVVAQALGKGWIVDSDPAASAVKGRTATFVVSALPGETVELHVGERQPPAH